jgi:3-oxoacyl-[acyl-carrier-protein] synthase III
VTSEIENNADVCPHQLLGVEETGAAVILEQSNDGRSGFGAFHFRALSQFSHAYASSTRQQNGAVHLHFVKDPRLHDYWLDSIPQVVRELLDMEGLELSQINRIFPPQISTEFVLRLSEKLQTPESAFVDITRGAGDHFTASFPCALQHARAHRLVGAGDVGLIINVGAGLQIGCAVYYF